MPTELYQVLDAERRVQQVRAECESRGAFHVMRIDIDRFDSEIAHQEKLRAERFGSSATRWLWWLPLLIYSGRIFCGQAVSLSGIPLFAVSLLVAVLFLGIGLILGIGLGLSQQITILTGAVLSATSGIGFAVSLVAINEENAKQSCLEIIRWKEDLARENSKIQQLRRERNSVDELLRIRTSLEALVLHAETLRQEFESIPNKLAIENWRAMRSIEFEDFLATVLRHHGFDVSTTRRTGDQGIDLIAVSQTMRLGIQVKGYENSVGNDAVQQAHAGKAHYKCTHSVVITNSVFTRSAKELAKSVECLLIDESQMLDLIAGRVLSAHRPVERTGCIHETS
ncbi:restriction endonuclease [Anatilimnocola aggregata]|nr:restriction endonuclease [Anatilimnocola aggregata]